MEQPLDNEVNLEASSKKKKPIKIILGLVIAFVIVIYIVNYVQLQSNMNSILRSDPRNSGIEVSAHYAMYSNPNVLIYDLKNVSNNNSMADVFRVFLQYAESVQNKKFESIELAFNGVSKFKISGTYFQTIGREYSHQNPFYTTRTFPENLMRIDGTNAYSKWTGGVLGVVTKQMEDFNDFHKKWYIDEIVGKK